MTPGPEAVVGIIEDDEGIREALFALMRAEGTRAEGFANVRDFLRYPRLSELVCAIVDVQLAGVSSFGLHAQLVERGLKVPLIFISADPAWAAHAARLDALFLRKPFSAADVLEAIRRVAGAREESS